MTTFKQDEPQVKRIYGLESKIYKLETENEALKEKLKKIENKRDAESKALKESTDGRIRWNSFK